MIILEHFNYQLINGILITLVIFLYQLFEILSELYVNTCQYLPYIEAVFQGCAMNQE